MAEFISIDGGVHRFERASSHFGVTLTTVGGAFLLTGSSTRTGGVALTTNREDVFRLVQAGSFAVLIDRVAGQTYHLGGRQRR